MANTVTISEDSTDKVLTKDDALILERDHTDADRYEFEVLSGRMRMGHTREGARNSARVYKTGDRGEVDPKGQPVFAYAESGHGMLEAGFELAGFSINLFPRETNNIDRVSQISQLQNAASVVAFSHDPATDNQLPSHSVHDRDNLLVQADGGNADDILVGNQSNRVIALSPGEAISIPVTDTSAVYVEAVSAGDTVNCMTVNN